MLIFPADSLVVELDARRNECVGFPKVRVKQLSGNLSGTTETGFGMGQQMWSWGSWHQHPPLNAATARISPISAHWRSTANLIPNARSAGLAHPLDATGRRVPSAP
jgi:hypothetical protein